MIFSSSAHLVNKSTHQAEYDVLREIFGYIVLCTSMYYRRCCNILNVITLYMCDRRLNSYVSSETNCRFCRASGSSHLHGTRPAQPQPPYNQCTGQPASRREHLHPHLHGLPQTSHNPGSQSHSECPASSASCTVARKRIWTPKTIWMSYTCDYSSRTPAWTSVDLAPYIH